MRRTPRQAALSGFTIVELMAGLAIGGTVLVLIHQMWSVTNRASHDLTAIRVGQDQEMNGRRWLRGALGSMHPATDSEPFDGRRGQLSFTASLRQAGGWFEARRAEIVAEDGRLLARFGTAQPLELADSVTTVAFDYLLDPGEDSRWVRQWISAARGPVAVRVRLFRRGPHAAARVDTVLFLVRQQR